MISQNIGVSVLPEDAVMIPTYGNLCLFLLRGLQKLESFICNGIRNVLFDQNRETAPSPYAKELIEKVQQTQKKIMNNVALVSTIIDNRL